MNNFFEVNLAYMEEGADKETRVVYMVDALSFMEAESNISKYLKEWVDVDNFNIKSMKKVSFDDLVFKQEQEDYEWHEAKVRMSIDGEKELSLVYLLADDNMNNAIVQMKEYLKDSDGDCRIISVKFKKIEDLVLRKECCKECDVCESTVRVLSFDEQKGLDVKFSELDKLNAEIMDELGAVSMSISRYTIKATEENLIRSKGKMLARGVKRTWSEDFVDEDTDEVVSIDRNEVLLGARTVLGDDEVGIIADSGVSEIVLYR